MAKILLIGKSGSGKTTLVNRLCNYNIATYYGGSHSTKQVKEYRLDQHLIIDTPSFEIKNETDGSHNFTVVDFFANLFQSYPITHILIIIRFQRLSDMRYDLQECIGPLRKFKQHSTVLITYWEDCQNKQIAQEQITQKVQQWFGLTTIFSDERIKDQIKAMFPQQNKNIIFDLSDTIFDNKLNDNQIQFIENLKQLKAKSTNDRPCSKNVRIKEYKQIVQPDLQKQENNATQLQQIQSTTQIAPQNGKNYIQLDKFDKKEKPIIVQNHQSTQNAIKHHQQYYERKPQPQQNKQNNRQHYQQYQQYNYEQNSQQNQQQNYQQQTYQQQNQQYQQYYNQQSYPQQQQKIISIKAKSTATRQQEFKSNQSPITNSVSRKQAFKIRQGKPK